MPVAKRFVPVRAFDAYRLPPTMRLAPVAVVLTPTPTEVEKIEVVFRIVIFDVPDMMFGEVSAFDA